MAPSPSLVRHLAPRAVSHGSIAGVVVGAAAAVAIFIFILAPFGIRRLRRPRTPGFSRRISYDRTAVQPPPPLPLPQQLQPPYGPTGMSGPFQPTSAPYQGPFPTANAGNSSGSGNGAGAHTTAATGLSTPPPEERNSFEDGKTFVASPTPRRIDKDSLATSPGGGASLQPSRALPQSPSPSPSPFSGPSSYPPQQQPQQQPQQPQFQSQPQQWQGAAMPAMPVSQPPPPGQYPVFSPPQRSSTMQSSRSSLSLTIEGLAERAVALFRRGSNRSDPMRDPVFAASPTSLAGMRSPEGTRAPDFAPPAANDMWDASVAQGYTMYAPGPYYPQGYPYGVGPAYDAGAVGYPEGPRYAVGPGPGPGPESGFVPNTAPGPDNFRPGFYPYENAATAASYEVDMQHLSGESAEYYSMEPLAPAAPLSPPADFGSPSATWPPDEPSQYTTSPAAPANATGLMPSAFAEQPFVATLAEASSAAAGAESSKQIPTGTGETPLSPTSPPKQLDPLAATARDASEPSQGVAAGSVAASTTGSTAESTRSSATELAAPTDLGYQGMANSLSPPPSARHGSAAGMPTTPEPNERFPRSPSYRALVPSPKLPAPGTVNPRDVWAPATDNERTVHVAAELDRFEQSPTPFIATLPTPSTPEGPDGRRPESDSGSGTGPVSGSGFGAGSSFGFGPGSETNASTPNDHASALPTTEIDVNGNGIGNGNGNGKQPALSHSASPLAATSPPGLEFTPADVIHDDFEDSEEDDRTDPEVEAAVKMETPEDAHAKSALVHDINMNMNMAGEGYPLAQAGLLHSPGLDFSATGGPAMAGLPATSQPMPDPLYWVPNDFYMGNEPYKNGLNPHLPHHQDMSPPVPGMLLTAPTLPVAYEQENYTNASQHGQENYTNASQHGQENYTNASQHGQENYTNASQHAQEKYTNASYSQQTEKRPESSQGAPLPPAGPYANITPPPNPLPSFHDPSHALRPDYGNASGVVSPTSHTGSTPGASSSLASPRTFPCDECGRVFDQVHKLNHHKRYHERPHECPVANCGKRFGTKTHLDRHINDKHVKSRKYHCTEEGCPYSVPGGKSFPRKDNWRRHMVNKHSVHPEHDPIEVVDQAMTGV